MAFVGVYILLLPLIRSQLKLWTEALCVHPFLNGIALGWPKLPNFFSLVSDRSRILLIGFPTERIGMSPAKILAVDDQRVILKMIDWTFSKAGHQVTCETDPKEVPALLAGASFDLAIIDMVMPGMDGFDLIKYLHENPRTQSLPVIVLSSLKDPRHRIRGLQAGAFDYVTKPFEPEELLVRAEGIMKRHAVPAKGVVGHLELQSVIELLQDAEQNRKSCLLKVQGNGVKGQIEIIKGQATAARCGDLTDSQAIEALLDIESGTFELTKLTAEPDEEKNSISLQAVIMFYAWAIDSMSQLTDWEPQPQEILQSGSLPAVDEEYDCLPLADVLQAVRDGKAQTAQDVLALEHFSPIRTRLSLAWLKKNGGITVARSA